MRVERFPSDKLGRLVMCNNGCKGNLGRDTACSRKSCMMRFVELVRIYALFFGSRCCYCFTTSLDIACKEMQDSLHWPNELVFGCEVLKHCGRKLRRRSAC